MAEAQRQKCTYCGEEKELDKFVKSALSKGGRSTQCKDCKNAYMKRKKEEAEAKEFPPDAKKICEKCLQNLAVSEFYRAVTKSGLSAVCKKCYNTTAYASKTKKSAVDEPNGRETVHKKLDDLGKKCDHILSILETLKKQ